MSRKNIKFKKPTFVLSPLALLTLAACGGGGGGGQSGGGGGSFSVGGHIVKGPLSNALVGLDYDGDGIVDSSTVRTGSDGSFTISTSNSNYTIIAVTDETTIDTSSGSVLAGATLKAPAGATVVTPTTTLMEEAGLTAAQVAAVLELPDGVDPLSFNPYAAGVDPDKALAVEQAGQQIMSAVTAFAAAAEGAGASKADAFEAALTAVADVVKDKATKVNDPNASAADKSLDLTSTADLALIKDKVVAEVSTTSGVNTAAFDALADDAATAVKNVNDEIATVTDLTSDAAKNVFSTVQVLTDQVKTAAAAEVNTAGSGSISFTDANVVSTAAKNKAPTDITLTSSSISEGASSLVVGTLSTTDSDQSDGVAFTYEIAEISGTDYGAFTINQSTGELSLKDQPDYETKTSYSLTIISTDEGGKTYSKSFSISVTDINEAPTLTVPAGGSVTEDASTFTITGSLSGTDPENASLTYSVVGSSATNGSFSVTGTYGTLALNAATGAYTYSLDNAKTATNALKASDSKIESFSVQVTDGVNTTTAQTLSFTIQGANDAPTVVNPIVDTTATEGINYVWQIDENVFADVDAGDSLTYTASLEDGSDLPAWLTFNAETLTAFGTPPNSAVGVLVGKLTAKDTSGATASDIVSLTVVNTNDAPTVANAISDQTIAEDSALSFQFAWDVFVDVDAGDSLTYTAALSNDAALPSWLAFDAATRTFSGTPLNANVGVIAVKVTATDSGNAAITDTFNITVTNTNDAPTVVNPMIDGTATEGVSYVWQFNENIFSDVDVGDSLTYTATLEDGSDLPSWLTFDADTLTASGTPPNSAVGVIVGKLTATDTSGASVSDVVALTVSNTNDAPTVANAIADQTIAEDSALSFQFASDVFVDVDAGDSFTYTATLSDGSALPSWLSFNADTRTFSGTPANADVGSIDIKVTATDGSAASVSDVFALAVTNTASVDSEGPTLLSFSTRDNTLSAGQTLYIDYDATDVSGIEVTQVLFYDKNGNQHRAEDRNDDGVAEFLITDQMLSGAYTAQLISMGDTTDLFNESIYYEDGRVLGDMDFSTHNFDLSLLDFTVL
ncbi:putative Ig domain-containing protein [Alphaproteobacteria bacterium US3C007]|nr:putative Ig domain-containing protein [Alphaproteobacteria bacterium US3C007]